MQKLKSDQEEWHYFSNNQWTPLHLASRRKVPIEVVKNLIEEGADVYNIWVSKPLFKYKMKVFTLINNFNDPFYQNFENLDEIEKSRMNILIENGMI